MSYFVGNTNTSASFVSQHTLPYGTFNTKPPQFNPASARLTETPAQFFTSMSAPVRPQPYFLPSHQVAYQRTFFPYKQPQFDPVAAHLNARGQTLVKSPSVKAEAKPVAKDEEKQPATGWNKFRNYVTSKKFVDNTSKVFVGVNLLGIPFNLMAHFLGAQPPDPKKGKKVWYYTKPSKQWLRNITSKLKLTPKKLLKTVKATNIAFGLAALVKAWVNINNGINSKQPAIIMEGLMTAGLTPLLMRGNTLANILSGLAGAFFTLGLANETENSANSIKNPQLKPRRYDMTAFKGALSLRNGHDIKTIFTEAGKMGKFFVEDNLINLKRVSTEAKKLFNGEKNQFTSMDGADSAAKSGLMVLIFYLASIPKFASVFARSLEKKIPKLHLQEKTHKILEKTGFGIMTVGALFGDLSFITIGLNGANLTEKLPAIYTPIEKSAEIASHVSVSPVWTAFKLLGQSLGVVYMANMAKNGLNVNSPEARAAAEKAKEEKAQTKVVAQHQSQELRHHVPVMATA